MNNVSLLHQSTFPIPGFVRSFFPDLKESVFKGSTLDKTEKLHPEIQVKHLHIMTLNAEKYPCVNIDVSFELKLPTLNTVLRELGHCGAVRACLRGNYRLVSL